MKNKLRGYSWIIGLLIGGLFAFTAVTVGAMATLTTRTSTVVDCGEFQAMAYAEGSTGRVDCVDDDIVPTPTATIEPTPTIPPDPTSTPPTCQPHDDTLKAHDYYDNPCDGSPPHTHYGWQTTAVPESCDDCTFGNWRGVLNLPSDQDFGFAWSTIGEAELKHFGYVWIVVEGLECTNGATNCIESVASLEHRMPLPMAQNVRMHSMFVMYRMTDGTLAYRGAWADTGKAKSATTGEIYDLPSDSITCPPDGSPCLDVPFDAQPHPESGRARIVYGNPVDGFEPQGFWYKGVFRNIFPNTGAQFETPSEMTQDGEIQPHIFTLSLDSFGNLPGKRLSDVYGCMLYPTCGDYTLPVELQIVAPFYLSKMTTPGYYQLRFDFGDGELQLTHNTGPNGAMPALDFFSATALDLAEIRPIPLALPTKEN